MGKGIHWQKHTLVHMPTNVNQYLVSIECFILDEGVFNYVLVSGLVNLDQPGQGSSFSGLLSSPCVPVWYRRLTCEFNLIFY